MLRARPNCGKITLAALACALATAAAATGQPVTSEPADTQPATRPGEYEFPQVYAPAYEKSQQRPRPPEFTEEEWGYLDDVYDASSGTDEEAYYILLEKVKSLDPARAVAVRRGDLIDNPGYYRGFGVRLTVTFIDVTEAETDKPRRIEKIYEVRALAGQGDDVEAVVLVSPDPIAGLKKGQRAEAIGYFYKVQRFALASNPDKRTNLPVVIVRQVAPAGDDGATLSKPVITITVLILLIVVYVLVRVKLSRRGAGGGIYRPRRFEMTDDDIEQSRRIVPPQQVAPDAADSPGAPGPTDEERPDS